jgi:hypothetical protein
MYYLPHVVISCSVMLLISAGLDYNGTVAPQVFIFSSHVETVTFQLPLINDSVYEISESLTASLSFPGPMPPQAFIGPDTANIYIMDEDCRYFTSLRNVLHFICFLSTSSCVFV